MNLDRSLRDSIEKIVGYVINPVSMNEDDLIDLLEEIVSEYEHLQDKYDDLEQQIEENYRPIPVAEQYGISDKDFI